MRIDNDTPEEIFDINQLLSTETRADLLGSDIASEWKVDDVFEAFDNFVETVFHPSDHEVFCQRLDECELVLFRYSNLFARAVFEDGHFLAGFGIWSAEGELDSVLLCICVNVVGEYIADLMEGGKGKV